MQLPPKHTPKPRDPRMAEAVAVLAETGRLNPVVLERRMAITLVHATNLIEQMTKILQESIR